MAVAEQVEQPKPHLRAGIDRAPNFWTTEVMLLIALSVDFGAA
jgi:hypothetical protein